MTGAEVIAFPSDTRLVLSCEHASQTLPDGYDWPNEDDWLRDTHWAYDIGAAMLTRELAALTKAPAVLATFSRLLIDPNRPLDSDTLIRTTAEGKNIALNRDVASADRGRRVAYWQGYHQALAAQASLPSVDVLFAIHSFTPDYEGEQRDLEIGVLFDRDEELGQALAAALSKTARTELNEPYSGKLGLIYSAQRHADAFGKRAIEIEVRQDRIIDAEFRKRIAEVCAQVLLG